MDDKASNATVDKAVAILARSSGGDRRGAHLALQLTARLHAVDIGDVAADTIRQDDDGRAHRHQVHSVRLAIEIVQVENGCDVDRAADLIRARAAGHGLPITEVASAIIALGSGRGSG